MNSFFKRLIIPILTNRPLSTLASVLYGTGIPIFMLHRVVDSTSSHRRHTVPHIRRCLHYLQDNGYSFVSLELILAYFRGEASLPKKPAAFTIDDGFYDQATLAAPIFVEFKCPVTIFLVSGMLDGELWPWFNQVEFLIENSKADVIYFEIPDKKETFLLNSSLEKVYANRSIREIIKSMDAEAVPDILDNLAYSTQVDIPEKPPSEHRPMTWDMARELEDKGIVFGPHTISHRILSRLNDKESEIEITGSWERLKSELSQPSAVFCYPNGGPNDFGKREIDIIRKSGFLGAVSTEPKQVDRFSPNNSIYSLPRFALPASFYDFVQYCSWIEYVKSRFRKSDDGDLLI